MSQLGVDSNTGLSPVNWNVWETNWVGVNNVEGPVITQIQNGSRIVDTSVTTDWWSRTTTTTWEDSFTQFRNDTFILRNMK